MTFVAAALFAPLVLLLPGAADAVRSAEATQPVAVEPSRQSLAPTMLRADAPEFAAWQELAEAFRTQTQNQVRIEQRVTIRVVPRHSRQANLLTALPNSSVSDQFVEKKMGKCVEVSGIVGVQASGPTNLILFMRDQRMISAALDRTCRARDFYSGFYLERSSDGKLCVDRDTLHSRSGANCKLTRLRKLVEVED